MLKFPFLNGDLEEEIFMKQPKGFNKSDKENKVCKLVKSLYGLKLVPKQWHEKFDQVILSYDFHVNNNDKCVYVKQYDDDDGIYLFHFVDNLEGFFQDFPSFL